MALITAANFAAYCDKIGAAYDLLNTALGTSAGGAAVGNLQNILANANTLVAGLDDIQQVQALGQSIVSLQATGNAGCSVDSYMTTKLMPMFTALDKLCGSLGSTVSSTITNIDSFLKWYSSSAHGTLFTNQVTPSFNAAYAAVKAGKYLTTANGGSGATLVGSVMSPAIDSLHGAANGMGTCLHDGTFTDGAAVAQSATVGNKSYSEVKLLAEVTTTFVGGTTADPLITVTGVDHLGNTGQTWTGTFTMGSHNPAAAISQQTVSSGAITGQTSTTVTVGSTTGIVPGAWVYVNKGAPDQELVLVSAVPNGTTFTAVFLQSHASSAKIDGNNCVALTNGSGRRCRDVTGITITGDTWSAGLVAINGIQDRVNN
jgi:hypothetical protein